MSRPLSTPTGLSLAALVAFPFGIESRLPFDPKHDPTQEPGFWLGVLMLHTIFTRDLNHLGAVAFIRESALKTR